MVDKMMNRMLLLAASILMVGLMSGCPTGSTCATNGDCAEGQVCNADGVCVQGSSGCTTDNDCDGNEVCTNGTCEAPTSCFIDADCPLNNQRCQGGLCVFLGDDQCQSDNDCDYGEVCNNGLCESDPCLDCAAANTEVCSCVRGNISATLVNVECAADADCRYQETDTDVCVSGICKLPCAGDNADADCTEAMGSNQGTGLPDPSCEEGYCYDPYAMEYLPDCGAPGTISDGTLSGQFETTMADPDRFSESGYISQVSGTGTVTGTFGSCPLTFPEGWLAYNRDLNLGGQTAQAIQVEVLVLLDSRDDGTQYTWLKGRAMIGIALKDYYIAGQPIAMDGTTGLYQIQDFEVDYETAGCEDGCETDWITALSGTGSTLTVGSAN